MQSSAKLQDLVKFLRVKSEKDFFNTEHIPTKLICYLRSLGKLLKLSALIGFYLQNVGLGETKADS